ncbi:HSP90 family protein [Phycicoccus sp. CSK15P-2]|uniref:HSP90 family protein n=1 Tax=Phycicoccus sp. CSK15P-2 TaxID=2807627 RepID=UPI001951A590|nr:HSP90 family protein [Phycicoccus sp. CSK15P-2]MBM6403610.1 HSP90 family protein [Phycicoccus sp. CSK15P-2]MBM6405075.1 HSP90 family protein [Phycicoccus sp. CSK15P-2]
MTGANQSFHVDLRGVVDLLSHHLYSSPRVYLRELVQNAVDAIAARREEDPTAPGAVRIVPADVSPDGRLHVVDTGVGLDEHGVRTALATIGASTKRDALGMARESFLGRFGIGLLSCFLVTDEIEVVTRAAGSGEGLRWRGRDDGAYTLEAHGRDERGTDVALAPRGSAAELLRTASVLRLARTYARHLEVDLVVETADGPVPVAGERFPWEGEGPTALRGTPAWCEQVLGFTPLDVVALADPASGLRGLAFVLPSASAGRPTARVHARRMLVSEAEPDLLPPWATFVRAVVDVDGLDLTASRESLRDDDSLAATRDHLGEQLRTWLVRIAATDRQRADRFFAVHHLGAKAMAATDDAMLDVVASVLPWETTLGTMTLAEFAAQHRVIPYVDSVEHYRQVSTVATAQGVPVLNAGYAYDSAIVERYVAVTPGAESRRMPPEELTAHVERLDADDESAFAALLDIARSVLARSDAEPVVRRFRPESMQSVLLVGDSATRERDRHTVADAADGPWAVALEALTSPHPSGPSFVLNAGNDSVRRLAESRDAELQRLAVEALYAQALLAGRHPQTPFDSALVARALPALIDRVIAGRDL